MPRVSLPLDATVSASHYLVCWSSSITVLWVAVGKLVVSTKPIISSHKSITHQFKIINLHLTMSPYVETTAYIVPLMDFERSLVMEVQAYVGKERTINQSSDLRSFEIWKWSQLLQDLLRHYLDTEEDVLRFEAGGSRSRAYEACFFGLENDGHFAKHRARMMQIRNANFTFVDDLAEKPSLSIRAVPDPNDQEYWRTLNSIVDEFGRPWDTPDELDRHRGKFDIFSLIRIYFLHSLSPLSATMISDSVTNHDVFLEHYTVSPNQKTGHGDKFQAQNAFIHRIIKKAKKPANILSDEELIVRLRLFFCRPRLIPHRRVS
jgi:hypothetical protein